MPDLLTHSAVAYLAARHWFGRSGVPRATAVLFIVGTTLPDLLSRPFYILFPALHWWVMPLHTPAGMLIVCWGIAGCFHAGERRRVFIALVSGVLLHFALDAPQKHIAAGYFWLFPFSWKTYEWGLWWSEDSVRLVPWVILLVAIVEILARAKWTTADSMDKRRSQKNGRRDDRGLD